jgi:hypothetical protein
MCPRVVMCPNPYGRSADTPAQSGVPSGAIRQVNPWRRLDLGEVGGLRGGHRIRRVWVLPVGEAAPDDYRGDESEKQAPGRPPLIGVSGSPHRMNCRRPPCLSRSQPWPRPPHARKKRPFRSQPISANELTDVARGAEANVNSPTVAAHSICAALRTNVPAKPPYTGSSFRTWSRTSVPLQVTRNDTCPGVGGGLSPSKRAFAPVS